MDRELRPLGVGEIVDVAINVYRRNFRQLTLIAGAIALPLLALIFGLDLIALKEAEVTDPNAALYQIGDTVRVLNESSLVGASIAQGVLSFIFFLLITGGAFRSVSEAYLGREPEVGESLRFAFRRILPLVWLSILAVIGIGIGFVILILPGIFLLVAWSVAVPALYVEDERGSKALGRSYRLVSDNWWRTLGALLVGFIFIAIIQFAFGALGAAFDGTASTSVWLWAILLDAINILAIVATAPLQAALITVIYYDLRVRKEGFDVAILTESLDLTGSAGPPATSTLGSDPPPTSSPPPGSAL